MTRISSAPITTQPVTYDIYNTFGVMGNEKILHEYTKEKRCCGCTHVYYTTFTDARLLFRTETKNCCYQASHTDVSIFLRDIAEIRLSTESRDNCECCKCCLRCCRMAKILEIRGIFGSKILRISEEDLDHLQYELPAKVGNHKLISHH